MYSCYHKVRFTGSHFQMSCVVLLCTAVSKNRILRRKAQFSKHLLILIQQLDPFTLHLDRPLSQQDPEMCWSHQLFLLWSCVVSLILSQHNIAMLEVWKQVVIS